MRTPEPITSKAWIRSAIAGGVLIVLGLFFAFKSLDYPIGTLHRMGSGLFPMVIGLGTAGLGAILALTARNMNEAALEPALRPLVFISLAVVSFALAVEPLGLIPAAFAAVGIAALSENRVRLREILVLAALASVSAWALFAVTLDVPFTAFGGN